MNRLVIVAAVSATMVLALSPLFHALGLQQSAPPRAEPARGATVRGRVTSPEGTALRRAVVTLTPTDTSADNRPPTARTNAQGLFEITNVAPGQYSVVVARPPYLATVWAPQSLPPTEIGRGHTVDLRDGQVVDGVSVTMLRGGVLTGRVFDERGKLLPDAIVSAIEAAAIDGGQPAALTGVSNATIATLAGMGGGRGATNAKGEFRIAGLKPASYYLAASSTEVWPVMAGQKETRAFALTFFPDVAPEKAQPIALAAGATRGGLEIRMIVTP